MRQVGTEILYFPGPPLLRRELVSRDVPIKTKTKIKLMAHAQPGRPLWMSYFDPANSFIQIIVENKRKSLN